MSSTTCPLFENCRGIEWGKFTVPVAVITLLTFPIFAFAVTLAATTLDISVGQSHQYALY